MSDDSFATPVYLEPLDVAAHNNRMRVEHMWKVSPLLLDRQPVQRCRHPALKWGDNGVFRWMFTGERGIRIIDEVNVYILHIFLEFSEIMGELGFVLLQEADAGAGRAHGEGEADRGNREGGRY